MEAHKLDVIDFTVETFDPTNVEVSKSVSLNKCTGCTSGCGIFPEPVFE